jgi:hypothetical protein
MPGTMGILSRPTTCLAPIFEHRKEPRKDPAVEVCGSGFVSIAQIYMSYITLLIVNKLGL